MEFTWQTVVLLLKGGEYFIVTGLIEVLWKNMLGMINCHMRGEITYYDLLHGFWVGIGTLTASFEANLLHHLTEMKEELLYKVFLELRKY